MTFSNTGIVFLEIKTLKFFDTRLKIGPSKKVHFCVAHLNVYCILKNPESAHNLTVAGGSRLYMMLCMLYIYRGKLSCSAVACMPSSRNLSIGRTDILQIILC